MLCSAGFDNAGFDRCAISLFASRPGRLFQNPNLVSSRRRSAIVEIVLAISKPGTCARRQLQANLLKGLPVQSSPKLGDDMFPAWPAPPTPCEPVCWLRQLPPRYGEFVTKAFRASR
jgi:hypothetical protein